MTITYSTLNFVRQILALILRFSKVISRNVSSSS